MKIDWASKLSSRKFWALLGALAVSVMAAVGAGQESVTKVAGIIGAVASCVTYMLAESYTDAHRGAGAPPAAGDIKYPLGERRG